MKKYLLPEDGNFYKANLHCHSTISDGALTPEELKAEYISKGYSVIAFTDHDILIPHNDLTDDTFLALNGFEMEVNEDSGKPWDYTKCCHLCLVALDRDNVIQPMWNEAYLFGNAPQHKDMVQYDKTLPPYIRRFSGEGVSEMIKIGKEQGFFVTYNHPTWSLEAYPEYIRYDGMHAFEMFNGSCLSAGFDDYNPRVYDDMLRAGKRFFCIGADDNHNRHPNTRKWDSGVAFTVIKCERLEYKAVTDALLNGHFYASTGPEIHNLWVEDGKIYIECSEADRIVCNYEARQSVIVYAENGAAVTKASFSADKKFGYVRLTVVDRQGRQACTSAYFPD